MGRPPGSRPGHVGFPDDVDDGGRWSAGCGSSRLSAIIQWFDRFRSAGTESWPDLAGGHGCDAALNHARFRVLYIKTTEPNGDLIILDGMSDEELRIEDADVPLLQYSTTTLHYSVSTEIKTSKPVTRALSLSGSCGTVKRIGKDLSSKWSRPASSLSC